MKSDYGIGTLRLALILIFLVGCRLVYAQQGFKGIALFESTCEDVKRILQIDECILPKGGYNLKEHLINIEFTSIAGENIIPCYEVPGGTVYFLSVLYKKPIAVTEFEYELEYVDNEKDQRSDNVEGGQDQRSERIDQYVNREKGISVFVYKGRITQALFAPTVEQDIKFGCKRKTSRN